MTLVITIIVCLVFIVGAIVGFAVLVRSGTKAQTVGLDSMLGGVQALHSDAIRDDADVVVFVYNAYTFNVTANTGKHAHFTISLAKAGGEYPREYTPADDETWERRYKVKTQPCIEFVRETRFRRFGKFLRINREVQTGDRNFDDKVYIESGASDELVVDALRRASVRNAIVALLDAGYMRVVMFRAHSPLLVSGSKPPAKAFERDHHNAHLKALADIAQGMPAIEVEKPGTIAWNVPTALAVGSVSGTFALFLVIIFAKNIWVTFTDDPFDYGLLLGFAAWFVAPPLLIVLMRGHSNAFGSLLLTWSMLLFGLPMGGVVGFKTLNALPDFSNAVTIDAKVTDKRISKSKNSYTHYITLDPGDAIGPENEFEVDDDLYFDLSAGGTARVVVHKGALGWTWIDSIKPPK